MKMEEDARKMNADIVDASELEFLAPASQPPGALTPMEMIGRALANGAGIETLEKLMALQERWEANQAKKAFIAAKAKARAEFKPLIKTNPGYAKRYKYENLDDVSAAVKDALAKYGLDYSWITEDLDNDIVRVTCVLRHENGHSESNSLSGDPKIAADPKANMNGFQRKQTAITYLERSTLKAILGIAAGDDDDAQSLSDTADYDMSSWTEAIIASTSMADLAAIGKKLKAEIGIPDSVLKLIRNAWGLKARQLGAEPQAGKTEEETKNV